MRKFRARITLSTRRVAGLILLAPLVLSARHPLAPLMSLVDLDKGRPVEVKLHNSDTAKIELLDSTEIRDNVRGAVRNSRALVRVNGREVRLDCGNYRLPVAVAGVQVDCAVTKGLLVNSRDDPWGLVKDARLRLWPMASAFMAPGT